VDVDHQLADYRQGAARLADLRQRRGSHNSRRTYRRIGCELDSLRDTARMFRGKGEPDIRAFARFLDDSDDGVCYLAAIHLLELGSAPDDLVDKAFLLLENRPLSEARGTQVALKRLQTEYGRGA
jgi:hypothetical protein